MKQSTVTVIDSGELEDMVKSIPTKGTFCIEAAFEWGNGDDHLVKGIGGVGGYTGQHADGVKEFNKWIAEPGWKTWGINLFAILEGLNALCLIPSGDILVQE